MKFLAAGAISLLSLAILLDSNQAGDKATFTISQLMREAHTGGLMKKVASGKASDAEKKKLVELYKALSQNKPPKGNEGDWKKVTGDMIKSAEAAAKGDEAAAKSLLKLVNCAVCHGKFKEDD